MKKPNIINSGIVKHLLAGWMLLMFCFAWNRTYSQDTLAKDGFHQYFYPDGKISSEGILKNGKPDGYWKAYNLNGTLKSEGNRKNFELDSLWKFYNGEGKLLVEINYRAGKKNGQKVSYLDKETIRENFRNDIKEGYTRYYFPDGKIKQEIPFVNGMEQGFGKEFGTDGSIITLTEYKRGFIVDRIRINRKDGNGKKQGKWYTFYDSGTLQTEVMYKDDKKNGYQKEYAPNGDLLKISKYIDGVIQPEAEEIRKLEVRNEYYPDGKVKISAMFRDGIPEGIRREYNQEGTVERSFLYSSGHLIGEGIVRDDGSRDGPWKEFYPDGTVKSEGRYDNGKQTGDWKYYYSSGKVEQAGKYNKQGKPEGTWKWYFETGNLLKEENYHSGLRDGTSTQWDENGKVVEEGEYLNGNEDGPWFEQIGDTYVKGEYRDGLRNGIWTYYYLEPDGAKTDSVVFFRGAFVEDNPDGRHVYYWDNGKVRDEGVYVAGKKEGDWIKYNSDGTVFLVITYRQGVEVKYDGVKIKPPFEKEEE